MCLMKGQIDLSWRDPHLTDEGQSDDNAYGAWYFHVKMSATIAGVYVDDFSPMRTRTTLVHPTLVSPAR
jgi:hypothetical protein